MTEDEAKTKWCPFARDCNTGGNRVRYGGDEPDDAYGREAARDMPCIGSACMAWRLGEPESGPVVERRPARSGTSRPEGEGWGYVSPGENPQGGADWVRREVIRHGFCGLAGRPA